jgi:hypothetical protein
VVWLKPAVLFLLVTAAAPILIHLLVQRRAEPFAFPTLRFLRPTRLASMRRRVLDDLPLLVVRCAILGAAVAALAGPLIVTSGRRDAWNRRVVRAVVSDAEAGAARGLAAGVFRAQEFSGPSLRDGVRRAIAWLEEAPPGRRELVVVSRFPVGALAAVDLAAVPRDVAIRLERNGTLPLSRSLSFGRVLSSSGTIDRGLTLDGASTIVSEHQTGEPSSDVWPVEVVAASDAKTIVDAAIDAVRAGRVWAAPPDRRARLIVLDGTAIGVPADAVPVSVPWMADAIARIAGDADVQMAARRVVRPQTEREPAGGRLRSGPWLPVARASDGTPIVAAAASAGRLAVVTSVTPSNVAMPILLRAVVNALAEVPDVQPAEVAAIPDADLRAWSRGAVAPPATPLRNVDADDRRWLWGTALLLLALEAWMRRARRRGASLEDGEVQRVA